MLVLTSVIVTVTPGRTSPDASLTLPSRDPFTACAAAGADDARTSTTIVPHTPGVYPQRRPIESSLTSTWCDDVLLACESSVFDWWPVTNDRRANDVQ